MQDLSASSTVPGLGFLFVTSKVTACRTTPWRCTRAASAGGNNITKN